MIYFYVISNEQNVKERAKIHLARPAGILTFWWPRCSPDFLRLYDQVPSINCVGVGGISHCRGRREGMDQALATCPAGQLHSALHSGARLSLPICFHYVFFVYLFNTPKVCPNTGIKKINCKCKKQRNLAKKNQTKAKNTKRKEHADTIHQAL